MGRVVRFTREYGKPSPKPPDPPPDPPDLNALKNDLQVLALNDPGAIRIIARLAHRFARFWRLQRHS